MKLAEPKVGSVIRYAYLWHDQAASGAAEGSKDRPALVLALAIVRASGETEVLVLAITHAPPRRKTDAVELSEPVRRRLGLDDEDAWVVTTEANVFVWPGPDLRPVPGKRPSTAFYGEVPMSVLKAVAASYLANRKRQLRTVRRDDP